MKENNETFVTDQIFVFPSRHSKRRQKPEQQVQVSNVLPKSIQSNVRPSPADPRIHSVRLWLEKAENHVEEFRNV